MKRATTLGLKKDHASRIACPSNVAGVATSMLKLKNKNFQRKPPMLIFNTCFGSQTKEVHCRSLAKKLLL